MDGPAKPDFPSINCVAREFLTISSSEAMGGDRKPRERHCKETALGGENNPKALNGQIRAAQGYPCFHGISESCTQDPIPWKLPIDFGKI
jgi:hypothetical protein